MEMPWGSLQWSDNFFNYVPAEQAIGDFYKNESGDLDLDALPDYDEEKMAALLRPAAVTFLEVNPDCPFDADWLVKDFIRRM